MIMQKKFYLPHKKVCLFVLLSVVCWVMPAQNTMETTYEKNCFKTKACLKTSALQKEMAGLILDVYAHLRRAEIDSLNWLTEGLSGKKKSKNLVEVNYVKSTYDKRTGIFDLFVNVRENVFNRTFNHIKISMLLKFRNDTKGNSFMTVRLNEPNFLLKEAEGEVSSNENYFKIRTSVRFGWFFDLFISKSNYNSVAGWRIQTALKNMKIKIES